MAMQRHSLGVDNQWHDCPSCDYKGGWHVYFKKSGERGRLMMLLQCPGCKEQYDLGLTVSIN